MTAFRPCIDLHQGQAKQIVGGSLTDSGADTNFVSSHDAAYYAQLYREHKLTGGHVIALGLEEEVLALIYPDSRGEGYGMRRFNDDQRMEFTLINDEPEVHFTHARGFIAKTSTADVVRLKELVNQAYTG